VSKMGASPLTTDHHFEQAGIKALMLSLPVL
jgi:hypothetical protein